MSKFVKNSLKLAKNKIKDKDFEGGLELAQAVLLADSNNYFAFIFAGKCLTELLQQYEAVEKYKEAIRVDSSQTLSYEGLISLFTKKWTGVLSTENLKLLLSSYWFLYKQTDNENETKKVEYIVGLNKAYHELQKYDDIWKLLETEFVNFPTNKQLCSSLVSIINNTENLTNVPSWVQKKLIEICLMEGFGVNEYEISFSFLIDKYSSQISLEKLLEICYKLFDKLSQAQDVLLEVLVQKDNSDWSIFENYTGKYQDVIKSKNLINLGKEDDAIALLKKTLSENSYFLPVHIMIIELYLKSDEYLKAEKICRAGLQVCKMLGKDLKYFSVNSFESTKLNLTYLLSLCLAGSEVSTTKRLSITTFEMILKKETKYEKEIYSKLIETLIDLNEYEKAESYLLKMKNKYGLTLLLQCHQITCSYLIHKNEEALKQIEIFISTNPNFFYGYFLIGQFLWNLSEEYQKDKSKCLTYFLKAVKLNVNHGLSFFYLGQYYSKIANDKVKALKCYEKSYRLNPSHQQTGICLADTYIQQEKLEAAITLYKQITDKSGTGSCKWAWLRLGLCHLKNKEIEEAIRCFQSVLRIDPDDSICWECLGESYVARGSYPSAWKSFNRARQLNPKSVFSIYQMGVVNQFLQNYSESIREFEEVLQLSPTYLPPLKGLAQSHLFLARKMLSEGRDETCIDHINSSLYQLHLALIEKPNFSCLWKLLGDCCSLVYPIADSLVDLKIPLNICERNSEMISRNKLQTLELGCKFYLKSLSTNSKNGNLWNDLAANYFYLALCKKDVEAKELAIKSLLIAKKAVLCDPNNHLIWNNLGIIAASQLCENKKLAQHAFIKSIEKESNNWKAWGNLGVLYLTSSFIELAHQAFNVAQSLQPNFVNVWVCQALTAEMIGNSDSMDLFRHSTELQFHPEAVSGYIWWVCHMISTRRSSKEEMWKSISSTLPQLAMYCRRNPNCAPMWTSLGFLLEEQNLNLESENAYKNSWMLNKDVRNSINYSRILSKNSKFEKAIEIYEDIKSDLKDFDHFIQFGAIFSRARLEALSKHNYLKAIEVSRSKEEKKEALQALAFDLWSHNRSEEAKQIFHQIKSYSWLLSIALLENNKEDINKICEITNNLKRDTFDDHLVAVMSHAKVEDENLAMKCCDKLLEKYPDSWQYHHLKCQLLFTYKQKNFNLLLKSIKQTRELFYDLQVNSLRHQQTKSFVSNNDDDFSTHLILVQSLLAAGSICSNRKHEALKEAQRFVFRHPGSKESWILLVGAIQADSILQMYMGKCGQFVDVDKLLNHVTTCDDAINTWILSSQLVTCLINKEFNKMEELMSKLPEKKKLFFKTWKEINESGMDEEKVKKLTKYANDDNKQLVAHLLQSCKYWKEAFDILNSDPGSADSYKIVKLTLDAFNSTKDQLWKEESATSSEKLRGDFTSLRWLLDGLVKIETSTLRKSQKSLNRSLYEAELNANDICRSQSISAWNLYKILHKKKDEEDLEKLRCKWQIIDNDKYEEMKALLI